MQCEFGFLGPGILEAPSTTKISFQRLDRAAMLAAEKGLTIAQIALAYVVNQL